MMINLIYDNSEGNSMYHFLVSQLEQRGHRAYSQISSPAISIIEVRDTPVGFLIVNTHTTLDVITNQLETMHGQLRIYGARYMRGRVLNGLAAQASIII